MSAGFYHIENNRISSNIKYIDLLLKEKNKKLKLLGQILALAEKCNGDQKFFKQKQSNSEKSKKELEKEIEELENKKKHEQDYLSSLKGMVAPEDKIIQAAEDKAYKYYSSKPETTKRKNINKLANGIQIHILLILLRTKQI